MDKLKKNKGITLVSLIITIIIMLILAAVSINAVVGNYGVVEQTADAKIETGIANEREAVQVAVVEDGLTEEATVGTALYDRTVENGNKWSIVYVTETGEIYGTGWEYIESGTEVSGYGETTYIWLANYKTGEIIRLEEGEYTALDYTSSVSVLDELVFNFDASVLSYATQDNIEDLLGDGVTMYNFDWTEESGITSTSLKFDGIDDYLTINITDTMNLENGLTMEFYGIISGDTVWEYDKDSESYDEFTKDGWSVFFSIASYTTSYSNYLASRMVICQKYDPVLSCVNFGYGKYSTDFDCGSGFFSDKLGYNVPAWDYDLGEEAYLVCVVDVENEIIKLYKNGTLVYSHYYSTEWWDEFLEYDLKAFVFGGGYHANYFYSCNEEAYAARLYTRPLTDEEVKENYVFSVEYHEIIKAMTE